MSDNKHNDFDLLIRSVLRNARENVPVRVWDGISAKLDKIQPSKSRFPFLRSAIIAAAAAAVAIGVIFSSDQPQEVPIAFEEEPMIAAVEPDMVSVVESTPQKQTPVLISYAATPTPEKDSETFSPAIPAEKNEAEPVTTGTVEVTAPAPQPVIISEDIEDNWEEGVELKERPSRSKASISFSSLAGSNSPESGTRAGVMKRPSIPSYSQSKPAIRQTTKTTAFGTPLSFGVNARVDLSQKWAIGSGISYTLLTSRFKGTYYDGSTSVSSDIRNNQHYIGIPVYVCYNLIDRERLSLYAQCGGAVEKGLNSAYHILKTSQIHQEDINGVQVSANIGCGFEFKATSSFGIYIEPVLRYYFRGSQPSSIRTAQPMVLGMDMGLRLHI